jgi:hypothetical protein
MKIEEKTKITESNKKIERLVNDLYIEIINQEKIIDECVNLGLLPNMSKPGRPQQKVDFSMPTGINYIRDKNAEMQNYIQALIQKINEQNDNIDNW